ncbi:glycosyltransferase [Oxalobacteraceae bacterium CAVE-383]|nr:glycosyltransferase [Oxalobacteraceae bacterium CAVE-383]
MNAPGLISVIVTTYNRPDALSEVLSALLDQTDSHYEIIVADDGSRDETLAAVGRFQQMQRQTSGKSIPIIHAWQSDDGFRASAVRNLGVYCSAGDYLIFLDGDCLPRPDYVARHRTLAEVGFMVSGSRVLLSERLTAALLGKHAAMQASRRGIFYWLGQRLAGNANKVLPLLTLPDTAWRHYRKVRWNRIKSCNLGIWRSDYAAVNGFDETFVGWGHEDADIVLRLARFGIRRKGGAFSTEVFHLWHKENTRTTESANRLRVEERMRSGVTQAEVGLRDYPREDQRITR